VIEIPRRLALRYRAVLRRCLADQEARGSWPVLVARADDTGLTLEAREGGVGLRYRLEGSRPPDAIAFRSNVMADFEGRTDEPAVLEQVAFGKGQVRWAEGGEARVLDVETVTPDSVPPFPDVPRRFTPLPDNALTVLTEASRTAGLDTGRLALSRLLLRGRSGEVVATDGRQLLRQALPLPWQEDVLVPRVSVLGCRELAAAGPAAIGRTRQHVMVRVGPWLLALAIDADSRFPDVNAVMPEKNAVRSRLTLHAEDAAMLLEALPKLGGTAVDQAPVTLDLGTRVAVLARAEEGPAQEVFLTQSPLVGKPVRVCVDRRQLLRALKLGFRDVHVCAADRPVLCLRGGDTYLFMPLDQVAAVPPNGERVPAAPPVGETRVTAPPEPEGKNDPMPAPQANGAGDENGRTDSPPPERMALADVIAEAEALRGLLNEALGRTARLMAALKHQRRQSRAVRQAMQSLRQLQLDP
jgi:hypothetical protein